MITRETMMELLADPRPGFKEAVIGKALVRIFAYQTESEKNANDTNIDNGVGFSGADAYSGSLTAKYFMKHNTLMPWQVEKWMKPVRKGSTFPRITKYAGQLNTIVEAEKPRVSINDMDQEAWDKLEEDMNRIAREGEDASERRAHMAKF